MERLYLCKSCGKEKYWMDMHTEDQCKNCWQLIENRWYTDRVNKSWLVKYQKYDYKNKRED